MFGLNPGLTPSRASKRITNFVYLFLLVFLFVAIGKAFCLEFSQAVADLLAGVGLFLGASTSNDWRTTFFVFMTILPVIEYISKLGLNFQRGTRFFSSDKRGFSNIAMIGGLVIYLVGWYMAFLAYREYKALAFGLPDRPADENASLRSNSDDEENKPLRRDYGTNNGPFTAFQGTGVRIGDA